jgi:O-antigen ligase
VTAELCDHAELDRLDLWLGYHPSAARHMQAVEHDQRASEQALPTAILASNRYGDGASMSDMPAGITSRSPPWFLDLTAWTVAFAISGYPMAALISTYMGIADDRATLPFRVFVVVLALAAMWIGVRRAALSAPDGWLIAFWLVYLCRLIWDMYFEYVDGAEQALLAFIVTVLVPAIALALISRTWVERSAALCLMAVGVSVCLTALWLNTRDMVADALYYDRGRLGFDKVDPITLGHVACTTLFASMALVACEPSKLFRAAALAASGIALAMLYFVASRGPLVAFVAGLVAFAVCRARWGYVLAPVLVLYAISVFAPIDLDVVLETLRLTDIGEDASSAERYQFYQEALNAFLRHPLFGLSYALPSGSGWVHNIFLEAAMATGVVGLLLFVVVIARALFRSAAALRHDGILQALLFLQFIVAAQFSGSLWSWTGLWIGIAMVCAQDHKEEGARPALHRPLTHSFAHEVAFPTDRP